MSARAAEVVKEPPPPSSRALLARSPSVAEMWGGICLGLAAFLQVELGVGCGRRAEPSTVGQSAELDRPITWAGRLSLTMGNATSAAAELGGKWSRGPSASSQKSWRKGGSASERIRGWWRGKGLAPLSPADPGLWLHSWSSGEATILHHFSAWVPVTGHEVDTAVDAFWARCQDSSLPGPPACDLLHYVGTYQGLNLCQLDVCDHLSTTCSFRDGLVRCSCRHGFFQAHVMDRTCTACESGFWLQNGTCIRCPFGFGGAGCQEPFLLALVVASCFAGLLLLLLLLLLLGLLLSGRAAPAQDPPVALPLSLHSVASSLPRAQLPWSMPESEEAPLGSRAHLALEDPDREGQHAAGAPRMKTFLGSQCPPPSAPLAVGGCSNLIFTGDTGEQAERNYF
ncbi:uncharacterized protein PHA67_018558 isoform 3-T3 [Liasis olivaceus]